MYIIAYRNANDGKLHIIQNERGDGVAEFDTRKEAQFEADKLWECQGFGYQIMKAD